MMKVFILTDGKNYVMENPMKIGDYLATTSPVQAKEFTYKQARSLVQKSGKKYSWIKKFQLVDVDSGEESSKSLNYKGNADVYVDEKADSGETDLWTTRPDIAQLLVDPEDGYLYSQFSHKKIKFLCPICKNQFLQDLNHVSQRGLSCPNCSDNISFPNKFMREILLSLNVDFEPEYSPIWIKPKRYDFYFEHNNKKYIIEMDGGLGHGNDPPNGTFWFDKDLSKSLDEYKDNVLASILSAQLCLGCSLTIELSTY